MSRIVAYYRVSTDDQGASGLGMEAQQRDVAALCAGRGWDIVAEYREVESGKRNDRPRLSEALHHAKVTNSTLVIAKLDRLSRNAAFIAALQDSGAKFIAADMPEATELTVHIMAAVAQAERKAIGKRTADALASVKARGTWVKADGTPYKSGSRLGNPNGTAAIRRAGKGNLAAIHSIKGNADSFARDLQPVLQRMRSDGLHSLNQIAQGLNAGDFATPRGGRWHPSSVRNLLARVGS
jgi:DNA invertase Pin-like site-specific DNA recombinase